MLICKILGKISQSNLELLVINNLVEYKKICSLHVGTKKRGKLGTALFLLFNRFALAKPLLIKLKKRSLLCISNNSCITNTFTDLRARFLKLYKRKVYIYI